MTPWKTIGRRSQRTGGDTRPYRARPPSPIVTSFEHGAASGAGIAAASWRRAVGICLALVLLLAVTLPVGIHPVLAQAPAASDEPPRAVVVGTKEAPPFAMKAPDGTWTGISIELWRHIAEKLNLQTTFREFKTVPDLLQATADGTLDASIAAITVTSERERQVDFTQPFYATGLGIAVPAHREIEWLPILKSFLTLRFLTAVSILIGAAIVVGTLIWLLERRHTEHYANGHRGLGTGLWWTASAMTQAAAPDKAPATLLGRALAMVWMIISVVIIASFTAGTTAQITSKTLLSRVRGEYDLLAVRTGTVAATSALDYLGSQHVSSRSFASAEDGLKALKAGRLDAFVYDKPLLEYVVRKEFADELSVLAITFDHQNYAIAVPPHSDLRTRIDLVMIDDLRTTWWTDMLARYLGRE